MDSPFRAGHILNQILSKYKQRQEFAFRRLDLAHFVLVVCICLKFTGFLGPGRGKEAKKGVGVGRNDGGRSLKQADEKEELLSLNSLA